MQKSFYERDRMIGWSSPGEFAIAKASSGTDDEERFNAAIALAWRTALDDPEERVEIAELLEVKDNDLEKENPPFRAEVRGAGFLGSEILIALAIGFALGIAKSFGEEAGEIVGKPAGRKTVAALRALWINHFRDRVNPPGSGRMGPEKEDDEENPARTKSADFSQAQDAVLISSRK
jgi:hypothetical protein